MAFARASFKRFNEVAGIAPPVGSYDPQEPKAGTASAFPKSQRFQDEKDCGPSPADFDVSSCSAISGVGGMLSSSVNGSLVSSTPRKPSLAPSQSMESLKEKKTVKSQNENVLANKLKDLERELKKLLQLKTDLNKNISQKEEEMKKLEGRLQHVQSDRSALLAKVASLEKDIKDVNKGNSILKNKLSNVETVLKKHDDRAGSGLKDIKKQLETKEKEIAGIKHNLRDAILSLVNKLQGITLLTTLMDNKMAALDISFDKDKDVDSAETSKKESSFQAVNKVDVLEIVKMAQSEAQKIRKSLEEFSQGLEGRVWEMKMRVTEKCDQSVKKLEQMSQELELTSKNLESSQSLNKSVIANRDALKYHNNSLHKIITRLKMEKSDNEDTVRFLKGEVFCLNDEVKQFQQKQFECKAEIVTHVEKIEQLEEKEELMNQNIRILTDKYHIVEQSLVEERAVHESEHEKLQSEVCVLRTELQDAKQECDANQRVNLDLILTMNKAKDEHNKTLIELSSAKSASDELRCEIHAKSQQLADSSSLLTEAKNRIDSLTEQIDLKTSQLDMLQNRLTAAEISESSLSLQLSELTGSHKKTIQLYLERIQKLEEEKSCLLEEKHNLITRSEALAVEISEVRSSLETKHKRFEVLYSQHDVTLEEKKRLVTQNTKFLERETELQTAVEELEQRVKSLKLEHESDIIVREKCISELESALINTTEDKTKIEKSLASMGSELEQLKLDLAESSEQKTRLIEERQYDSACANERFAVLETQICEQQQLFQELKTDFTSKLESAETDVAEVQEEYRSYQKMSEREKLEGKQAVEKLQSKIDQLQIEREELQDNVERYVAQRCSLSEQMEQLRDQHQQQVVALRQQIEEQEQVNSGPCTDNMEALTHELNKWKSLYTELQEKVAPFMDQIDAFEAERLCLLGRSADAEAEISKLSMQYASLLGHQNQKQKIKHIMKIKQENNDLRQEATQLRDQVRKLKRQVEKLDDQQASTQGKKRFDISKAFQHSKKSTRSPLKEGNRI